MKQGTLLNVLKDYKDEGFIHAIDLEFSRFLLKLSPKVSPDILLAACLASYLYRQGNICLVLKDYSDRSLFPEAKKVSKPLRTPAFGKWISALTESELVGSAGDFTPLILDESGRLYLHKLWMQERSIANILSEKASQAFTGINYEQVAEGLDRLFPSSLNLGTDWQKVAAVATLFHPLSIISGGPGTGKTTTVVRIIAMLLEQIGQSFEIALAAPTGKAAARLQSSVVQQKQHLKTDQQIITQIPDEVVTLHRLLGARRNTAAFRYNENNRLPHDLVIVDEASMVDQRLMNQLLLAIKKTARLIFIGDKDQLASVEAGSVLGDICAKADNTFSLPFCESLKSSGISISGKPATDKPSTLTDNIVLLQHNFRFSEQSGINRLIKAVKKGEGERALELLNDERYKDIQLVTVDDFSGFWQQIEPSVRDYFGCAKQNELPRLLLEASERFKILCAHRKGPFGIESLNGLIEKQLRKENIVMGYEQWYEARPVIIRSNNYQLQLYNGDFGICQKDSNGDLRIFFSRENSLDFSEPKTVHPDRLPGYDAAYALTIHQSQGSEFDHAIIVLPSHSSKILTRELFYTAVSRARKRVTIIAHKKVVKRTIEKKHIISSGLVDFLWP